MVTNRRPIAGSGHKRDVARLFSATSGDHQRQALFLHHGEQLVKWAGIQPGDRVLDVAAGTGASLLPAARIAGPQGRLVGVDIAPGMVHRLSTIIAAEGLTNATVQVADAESLPFPESSFDALLCGFALFFFTDLATALAEFRRVLGPGGRLAVATFTQAGSRSIDRTWSVLGQYATVPPPPNPAMRFDDPTPLREVLEALEEQVVLMRLLGESDDQSSVTVRIGAENDVLGLRRTSVVAAGYGSADRPLAKLGVVGPTRMDYPTAMGAVRAVARYTGQILAES